MENTMSEEFIKSLAKALAYMDIERMDMGDSHQEQAEFLCEEAGIEFDDECSNEYYYEEKSIEAYEKMIRDGSINSMIESIVDENYENLYFIRDAMVYTEHKPVDIKEHPTVKAVCLMDEYVQNINNEDICGKEYCSKMREIREKLLSIDIELCYVGNTLGHTYFRDFNPEYYFRSNTGFTVGHILGEDDIERKLGEYTIHAEINSSLRQNGDDQGYTIAFNREDGNIVAHIYLYTTTLKPYNMVHKDTGHKMIIDTKDLDAAAKDLANKVNELAESDFGSKKESQNENPEEETTVNVVRHKRR